MLRHAIAPSRRYTKASHDVVRHPRLCSDAKILILYVQGLPEGQAHPALSEHARKLGIKGRSFQRVKEQLVVHGYVHERRVSGERGLWATHQIFSNVPLDDAGAGDMWRREAEEPGSGGDRSPGGSPGAPAGVSFRASLGRSPSPSAHVPAVGRPRGRTVGHHLPVDEERGKTSSHPPSETPEASEVLEAPETPEASGAPEVSEAPEAPEVIEAERVLLSLRHSHRELYLGVAEARALVGQAVEWLRRGMSGSDLRQVLTSDLPPGGVRSAVGFLRHRLVQKMPAPLAAVCGAPGSAASVRVAESASRRDPDAAPVPPFPAPAPDPVAVPRYVAPLVTCEGQGTEHVFRSLGGETRCPDCEQEAAWARWAEYRIAALGGDALPEPGEPRLSGWRARLAAATAAAAERGAGTEADRHAEPETDRPPAPEAAR